MLLDRVVLLCGAGKDADAIREAYIWKLQTLNPKSYILISIFIFFVLIYIIYKFIISIFIFIFFNFIKLKKKCINL